MTTPGAETYRLYGKVRYMRSETITKKPCICCDGGPHIFAYELDIEANDLLATLPRHLQDARGWLYRVTQQVPDGARLRVTVEVVESEDDAEAQP